MFRPEALARLSSPEQLDQLMRATHPRAWLVLAALGTLLGAAAVWSVVGTLATTVPAMGILVKSGGLLDVSALGSGQVTVIYVEAGQAVQRGEIVARIAQPQLTQELEKARAKLEELRRQHARVLALGSADEKLKEGYAAQERDTMRASIAGARRRLEWLREREQQQQRLNSAGLVTKGALEATRDEMRAVAAQIDGAAGQIRGLSVSTAESAGNKEREALAGELRISEQEREIAVLAERLEQTSRVVSPHSGRVLEVRAKEGDVVGPGRSILNLERAGSEGSGLEVLLFVPLAQGKMVRPGMRVQVAPDSIAKEEHGVLVAIVTGVSDFPATEDGMRRVLGNDLLVRNLLGAVGLAPIAVQAELVPDSRTASGYRWASGGGPPLVLGPGTPCHATIAVERTPPIIKVIPALKPLFEGRPRVTPLPARTPGTGRESSS